MRRSVMFILLAAFALAGCDSDAPVPVVTVKTEADAKVRRAAFDVSALNLEENGWKPVQVWSRPNYARNPFRGFIDAILAEKINEENRKAMEEDGKETITLPTQMYNVRDYRLVAVITGTADPKAFVIDPSGKRFVLRRGDLIGNNNGTVSIIHREKVEVFEMVSGEGNYIELLLYPEERKGITIKMQ